MATVYSVIFLLSCVLLTLHSEADGAAIQTDDHRMMADAAPRIADVADIVDDLEDDSTNEGVLKRAMDFSKAIQGPRGFGKRGDNRFLDLVAQSKARGFGRRR